MRICQKLGLFLLFVLITVSQLLLSCPRGGPHGFRGLINRSPNISHFQENKVFALFWHAGDVLNKAVLKIWNQTRTEILKSNSITILQSVACHDVSNYRVCKDHSVTFGDRQTWPQLFEFRANGTYHSLSSGTNYPVPHWKPKSLAHHLQTDGISKFSHGSNMKPVVPDFWQSLQLITFDSCESRSMNEDLELTFVGDITLHESLQRQADQLGFDSLWQDVGAILASGDILIGNLEGPVAQNVDSYGNDNVSNEFSGYPLFNYPPLLLEAIKEAGFTVLSTANNHALDRKTIGVRKTIENMARSKIISVGTFQNDIAKSEIFTILQIRSYKIAFSACTEHTNGFLDLKKQVQLCYAPLHRKRLLRKIKELQPKVDVIVILAHYGNEYSAVNNEDQIDFAHQALEAGATLVIGSHTHVLQPVEKYITEDGREAFIAYGLGNFVSGQKSAQTQLSAILKVRVGKCWQETEEESVARIVCAGATPIKTTISGDRVSVIPNIIV